MLWLYELYFLAFQCTVEAKYFEYRSRPEPIIIRPGRVVADIAVCNTFI